MNSVYVPAQVVAMLKRLANAVGAFSISHQYLVHKRMNAEQRATEDTSPGTASTNSPAGHTLADLKLIDWPSWPSKNDWKRARNIIVDKWTSVSRNAQSGMYESLLRAETSSLPWLGRTITWPSVFSLQLNPNPDEPQGGPPPSANRKPDKKRNRDTFKLPPEHEQKLSQLSPDTIHQLLASPVLYDPLRRPRFPIVLCHGLYGFDTRGPASFPSMRVQYWAQVLKILRNKVGAEVIVTSVPGTGSIASRAARLDEQLQVKARGRGINLLAHSMGGLDSRHLISHVRPREYAPLSLTTVSTPHRGSPFMDWCVENIGIGKLRQQERELEYALKHDLPLDALPSLTQEVNEKSQSAPSSFSLSFSSLPSSFTMLLLSIVDSPAYANLTSAYLNNVFNPATPDDPNVKYFSVTSRLSSMSIWHPLWLPKLVLDETENKQRLKLKESWEQHRESGAMDGESGVPLWALEQEWGNDGLVTVQSAKWGEFLGTMEGCDHWDIRGAGGLEFDLPSLNTLGFGSASPNSDSWSIMDWSWFVNTWRREERIEHNAKLQRAAGVVAGDPTETAQVLQPPRPPSQAQIRQRQEQRAEDDAVVKASTDKLSLVLDWLVDQIPTPAKNLSTSFSNLSNAGTPLKAPEKVVAAANDMIQELSRNAKSRIQAQEVVGDTGDLRTNAKGNGDGTTKAQSQKNELASKEDFERFYVALSRKLYDEGL